MTSDDELFCHVNQNHSLFRRLCTLKWLRLTYLTETVFQ